MVKQDLTTTVARRRCDKGHLIRPGLRRTVCNICDHKKRYYERRARGMDCYSAAYQNKYNKSLINSISRMTTYHKKRRTGLTWYEATGADPVKVRKKKQEYYKKRSELYGGNPTQNTVARLKWLIKKEGIQTTSD